MRDYDPIPAQIHPCTGPLELTNGPAVQASGFRTQLTSPFNRLQSILTDKKHTSLTTRQSVSDKERRRSPSIGSRKADQWQSSDSRRLIFLEAKAVAVRKKHLLRLVLTKLTLNLAQSDQMMLAAANHFLARLFQNFKQYTVAKKQERRIVSTFGQRRDFRDQQRHFGAWRELQRENYLVKEFRCLSLQRTAFNHLVKGLVTIQRTRDLSNACVRHHQLRLLNRVIATWRQISSKNRPERLQTKVCIAHMSAFRLSRIVKGWFNQVDLLKHEQALQADVLRSRIIRLKRFYFATWLS